MSGRNDRIEAIEALGYSPREAAFLACVTHHSGYFVRRQFLQWVGRQKGQTVVNFTQRLIVRRHATAHRFCRTTQVYHVSAKGLYAGGPEASIGQRRRRPAVSIKARLMALDFVASRPDVAFFTSDGERVAYCDVLGIDRGRLPQQRVRAYRSPAATARYFPESSPMGILQDGTHPSVLVCAYIDDGARSVAGFETYLRRYARLLAVLPSWRVIHVSESQRQGHAAAGAFRKAFGLGAHTWPETAGATVVAIREYFHLRQAFEAQDWAALNKTKLDRFRDLRQRFKHDLDALYARWEVGGDGVVPVPSAESSPDCSGAFETAVLSHAYDVADVVKAHS